MTREDKCDPLMQVDWLIEWLHGKVWLYLINTYAFIIFNTTRQFCDLYGKNNVSCQRKNVYRAMCFKIYAIRHDNYDNLFSAICTV